VTAGGFNSNLDMVLQYRPELKDDKILEGSGPGSIGDGHHLVEELGGYLTHMDQIWFYVYATPDHLDTNGRRGLAFRQAPGYIGVNSQGRRFHNEALSGGNSASPALLAQSPRQQCRAIMDATIVAVMEIADPYYQNGIAPDREKHDVLLAESPYIHSAGSLAELAGLTGVDEAAFMDTVERYNAAFDQGLEAEPESAKASLCRRNSTPRPITPCSYFPWRARISAASRPT
jgi:hypothetical protein